MPGRVWSRRHHAASRDRQSKPTRKCHHGLLTNRARLCVGPCPAPSSPSCSAPRRSRSSRPTPSPTLPATQRRRTAGRRANRQRQPGFPAPSCRTRSWVCRTCPIQIGGQRQFGFQLAGLRHPHAAGLVRRRRPAATGAARHARRVGHRPQRRRRVDLVERGQRGHPLPAAGPARASRGRSPIRRLRDDPAAGRRCWPCRDRPEHRRHHRRHRRGRRPGRLRAGADAQGSPHRWSARSGSPSTPSNTSRCGCRCSPRVRRRPAFEVGFSQISFDVPGAEQFQFTPPPGATVDRIDPRAGSTDAPPASESSRRRRGPGRRARPVNRQVVGTGWTTVVVATLPTTCRPPDPGRDGTVGGSTGTRRPGRRPGAERRSGFARLDRRSLPAGERRLGERAVAAVGVVLGADHR